MRPKLCLKSYFKNNQGKVSDNKTLFQQSVERLNSFDKNIDTLI